MLAVTVMPGPRLSHAVPHCRELRARHPHLTFVLGGYFPTQLWEACLRSGYVDYVVRGHAELAFRDLLRALARAEDPPEIAGIARRTSGQKRRGSDVGRLARRTRPVVVCRALLELAGENPIVEAIAP